MQVCYMKLDQPHMVNMCYVLADQISAEFLEKGSSFTHWRHKFDETILPTIRSMLEEEQEMLKILTFFHARVQTDPHFDFAEPEPVGFASYAEHPLPLFALGEQLSMEDHRAAADKTADLAGLLDQPAQASPRPETRRSLHMFRHILFKPADALAPQRPHYNGCADMAEELFQAKLNDLSRHISAERSPSLGLNRLLLRPSREQVDEGSEEGSHWKLNPPTAILSRVSCKKFFLRSSSSGGVQDRGFLPGRHSPPRDFWADPFRGKLCADRSFGCSTSPRTSKFTGLNTDPSPDRQAPSKSKNDSSLQLSQSKSSCMVAGEPLDRLRPGKNSSQASKVDQYFSQAHIYPALTRKNSRSPQHIGFEE